MANVKLKLNEIESNLRGFTKLMFDGKIKQAMKLIDSNGGVVGVHQLSDDIKTELLAKHPEPRGVAFDGSEEDAPQVLDVRFEDITSELIIKSAKNTFGSGGPTKVGSDIWKTMLCSKKFGKFSIDLAEEVATLARALCTKHVPFESISTLVACRLVPLMKDDDGIRPVGIWEVLRRIIGKSVTKVLEAEIQKHAELCRHVRDYLQVLMQLFMV